MAILILTDVVLNTEDIAYCLPKGEEWIVHLRSDPNAIVILRGESVKEFLPGLRKAQDEERTYTFTLTMDKETVGELVERVMNVPLPSDPLPGEAKNT